MIRPKTVVGLDIGSKQVKVVQLRKFLGKIRLVNWSQVNIDPEGTKSKGAKAEEMTISMMRFMKRANSLVGVVEKVRSGIS